MYELKILLQTVLLPPVNCFVLALIGVWLRSRRVGRMLIWATGMLFIVSSLPVVGLTLMDAGSRRMAISDDAVAASQAIVLLPGGLYANAAEYNGRDVASNNTLVRGRYAAWLHRRHGLPILVVGERASPSARTEAATAAELLRKEFHVPVRWVLERGRDTLESARYAAEILMNESVWTIVLVTGPKHARRAEAAFRGAGFDVHAAPTPLHAVRAIHWRDFLPSNYGFGMTRRVMNEGFGFIWTRLWGFFQGPDTPVGPTQ